MSLRVTDDEYLDLLRKTDRYGAITPGPTPPKKNKYGAVRKEVDGHVFHSTAEAKRYIYLKSLQQLGDIASLEVQPEYPIWVNGKYICTYRADFRYYRAGVVIVEDVKGHATDLYLLKKSLVEATYPVFIEEIKAHH